MKWIAMLGLAAILGGCGAFEFDRQIPTSQHGRAVRANIAAQVIDPLPPQLPDRPGDGQRAAAAIDRLRTGERVEPSKIATAGDVSSTE